MSAGMLLSALFDGLIDDVPDCHVSDMTSDSRQVVPGGLFIACRGVQQHGLEYFPRRSLPEPLLLHGSPSRALPRQMFLRVLLFFLLIGWVSSWA